MFMAWLVPVVLVSSGVSASARAGMGARGQSSSTQSSPSFFTPAQTQGDLSQLAPPKLNGQPIELNSRPDGQYSRIWEQLLNQRVAYDQAVAKAKPTLVPLPNAAVGGLVLMSALGGYRVVRRRPMS
jgi:hypothetical protein